MPQSTRQTIAGTVLASACMVAGCAVFDALGPAGPRGVTFVYAGDTVLSVGDSAALAVTVLAQGVPLPPQRLRVAILPDSTNVTLNAAGDTLLACRAGQAALLVQLLHSSASGTSIPDTMIDLHVIGGGSPSPRCP